MRYLVLVITFFFVFAVPAKEPPLIDSLKKFIATAPDDSNKVNAIYKLGTQYNLFKSKEHIPQFISALNLSKKIGHKNNRAKIYLSLVTTLFYNNIYDLGMEYALEGLTFIQKEGQPHEQFILHSMLGNLCSKVGQYEKGKQYYYELLTYKKNLSLVEDSCGRF